MKRIINWLSDKKLAVLSVLVLAISLVPIFYLAPYARPSGDDYGYSILTHAAWQNTHSLIEVFKAGIETVKQMYIGWNGDWFTTFLFSLMPEVFVTYSFWIVPYIMVAAFLLGTGIFLYYVTVKILGLKVEYSLLFISLLSLVSIQFIPSTAIGMYWYVGAVHYIIPHMLALLALTFGFRYCKTWKWKNIIYATLCMFAVGGSSYFSSLLVFMVFGLLIVLFVYKKKDILLLLIPFLVGVIGFIIQCLSPGNKVRAGESFGLHASDIFQTIWNSISMGITTIGSYIIEKPIVFVVLFICAVFGWLALLKSKTTFSFRYPFLFIIFMFGIYSAMWTPAIYSGVEVSLGPATIVYFTFLLTSFLSILYVEGWILEKYKNKNINKKISDWLFNEIIYRQKIVFPLIIIALLITLFNAKWFSNSTDMKIYDYVSSGQAKDFRIQIQAHMEILLDDTIKEAYLIPINDDQGPLMHMPITTEPENFTNRVVRDFYNKDIVVMISDH